MRDECFADGRASLQFGNKVTSENVDLFEIIVNELFLFNNRFQNSNITLIATLIFKKLKSALSVT